MWKKKARHNVRCEHRGEGGGTSAQTSNILSSYSKRLFYEADRVFDVSRTDEGGGICCSNVEHAIDLLKFLITQSSTGFALCQVARVLVSGQVGYFFWNIKTLQRSGAGFYRYFTKSTIFLNTAGFSAAISESTLRFNPTCFFLSAPTNTL